MGSVSATDNDEDGDAVVRRGAGNVGFSSTKLDDWFIISVVIDSSSPIVLVMDLIVGR